MSCLEVVSYVCRRHADVYLSSAGTCLGEANVVNLEAIKMDVMKKTFQIP